ncbi:MAG: hypothetical protein CR972_01190 [Candidatus Moraniibacteriota bacterium]|nr:MAG: hypothetical protein CR972_01190 [Candidatus Moranbacteria bacterium]
MDGLRRRKNIQKNSNHDDYIVNTSSDFLSDSDNAELEYHIFELGRSYKKGDDYQERFSGKDPLEEIDVRALLDEKDFDFTVENDAYNTEEYVTDEYVVDEQPREDVFSINADESFEEPSFEDRANFLISNEQEEKEIEEIEEIEEYDDQVRFSLSDLPIFTQESVLHSSYISRRFALMSGFIIFFLSFGLFVGTAVAVKGRVKNASERAITSMKSALESVGKNDLDALSVNIDAVHEEFVYASKEMDKISPIVKFVSRFVPGTSKLSSGDHIVEAGKYLSHTASEFGNIVPAIMEEKERMKEEGTENISFLGIYQVLADCISVARYDIAHAQEHINKVCIDDVPENYRDSFMQIKEILPQINNSLQTATEVRSAVEDLLGANGPRTYLLLFQNNHEMRATGGFIGSYGIVKMNGGRIDKMFVDDIYNPDGQLIDHVVPPLPIQKISANWSLHDSNWFVNFPVSAKKAMDFYERTGGPTVDGVIAITPVMMKKILEITGPVELKEYNLVLTADNFMRVMQNEVEDRENYTVSEKRKEPNNLEEKKDSKEEMHIEKESSKKVLSSLMPIMIERISDKKDPQELVSFLSAISEGVRERHIVMYTSNQKIQKIIEDAGWGGEVLQAEKDYLSVVNTNINGFKTDGVITETINHTAEIDEEGYIINTVKITREHKGGLTGYPWWDAVNADYMRVYVPEGSQFLSVEGQTREINEERLDYDALGYERDIDVEREESQIMIDQETGTRIYNEYGKTVFANWVYVSPQENVTVTYKYRLPFRVDFFEDEKGKFGSYSIVFQKQSGSERTSVESHIVLDAAFERFWHTHDNERLTMENNLLIDRFNGVVFVVK